MRGIASAAALVPNMVLSVCGLMRVGLLFRWGAVMRQSIGPLELFAALLILVACSQARPSADLQQQLGQPLASPESTTIIQDTLVTTIPVRHNRGISFIPPGVPLPPLPNDYPLEYEITYDEGNMLIRFR